ncbi:hypothetical protein [Spirosoma foliorum]|uniref:Uncharacterized protein n=1 Tax=Spirosoma foliorum TaxID=2710596 RepID=A0A7G5H2K2_9BACT|nr:hypothetical protein [Spirosoma foliorum]QMW05344.1 hypothetical protein H3H32_10865 [Spirosoma foliorum]
MKHISLSVAFFAILTCNCINSIAQDILKFKNGDELKVKVQEITPAEIKYKRFDNPNGPMITILKSTATSIQYENGVVEKIIQDSPGASYVDPTITADVSHPGSFDIGDIIATDYFGVMCQGKVIEVNKRRAKAVIDLNKNGTNIKVNRAFSNMILVKKAEEVGSPTGNSNSEASIYQNNADLLRGQVDANRYYKGYTGAGTGTFFTSFLFGPIIGLIPAAACSSTPPTPERLGMPNVRLAQNPNYVAGYTQEARRIKSKKVWSNFGIGSGLAIALSVALLSSHR